MVAEDIEIIFEQCEQCGEYGLERLETHCHCVNCNYFENFRIDEPGIYKGPIDPRFLREEAKWNMFLKPRSFVRK